MPSKFAAIMVGCGAMSGEWIRSAQEIGIEIAALVDLNLEFARARASEFQLKAGLFDNLDEAIRIHLPWDAAQHLHQLDPAAGAVEQTAAQLVLELADLLAQWWL